MKRFRDASTRDPRRWSSIFGIVSVVLLFFGTEASGLDTIYMAITQADRQLKPGWLASLTDQTDIVFLATASDPQRDDVAGQKLGLKLAGSD